MNEIPTKPYLLRALFEWCVDNGYTPHVGVKVDSRAQVPSEYVKNGEITLNISPNAVHKLQMGNELIEFSARFGGFVSRWSAVRIRQPAPHQNPPASRRQRDNNFHFHAGRLVKERKTMTSFAAPAGRSADHLGICGVPYASSRNPNAPRHAGRDGPAARRCRRSRRTGLSPRSARALRAGSSPRAGARCVRRAARREVRPPGALRGVEAVRPVRIAEFPGRARCEWQRHAGQLAPHRPRARRENLSRHPSPLLTLFGEDVTYI